MPSATLLAIELPLPVQLLDRKQDWQNVSALGIVSLMPKTPSSFIKTTTMTCGEYQPSSPTHKDFIINAFPPAMVPPVHITD
jgi:hypothetical protein